MDIVLAGFIALEETVRYAKENEESLMARYPKVLLSRLFEKESLIDTGLMVSELEKADLSYILLEEGGLFRGLWELGETFNTGISVHLEEVRLLQEVVEISEFSGTNPYMMGSKGAALIRTNSGDELVKSLLSLGIDSTVIGTTTTGNDRVVFYDENVLYLTPYKEEK